MNKLTDASIKFAITDNVIEITKVFRLRDVGKAIDNLVKENQAQPYLAIDFRKCGNPMAISSIISGNVLRVDGGVAFVFNKAMKVMRPMDTAYTLFVTDQRFGESGNIYVTKDFEVEITNEAVNVKKTGYYEDVLRCIGKLVGYLKCPDNSLVPCWRAVSGIEVNTVPEDFKPALDMSQEAMKKFISFKPKNPFGAIANKSAPVVLPSTEVIPEITKELPTQGPINVTMTEEPIKEPDPIEETVKDPEPIEETVKDPESVKEPEPVKEHEPEPVVPPKMVNNFAPISKRNISPFAVVIWGGVRLVRFNPSCTAVDVAKNIGADILYFQNGADSSMYGSLVMSGQYMLTVGDTTTMFPGTVLFKKEAVTKLPSGSFTIRVRTNDSGPCNIPTTFMGSTLIR